MVPLRNMLHERRADGVECTERAGSKSWSERWLETTVEASKEEIADFPGNPWLKHGVPWASEKVQELEDERILTIRKYACKDLV